MNGTVEAVSLSAIHGFSKVNVPGIRLLAGLGVEGDAHLGATVQHRSRAARVRRGHRSAESLWADQRVSAGLLKAVLDRDRGGDLVRKAGAWPSSLSVERPVPATGSGWCCRAGRTVRLSGSDRGVCRPGECRPCSSTVWRLAPGGVRLSSWASNAGWRRRGRSSSAVGSVSGVWIAPLRAPAFRRSTLTSSCEEAPGSRSASSPRWRGGGCPSRTSGGSVDRSGRGQSKNCSALNLRIRSGAESRPMTWILLRRVS